MTELLAAILSISLILNLVLIVALNARLERWRIANETAIRRDAVARSGAVIRGKVSEQLAPYLPAFPFEPQDVRFLGSPIDFIVFDGADEGCVERIIFVEVKSGSAKMCTRQRQIRDAILDGRVSWQELRI
jgi:predicted Holliday junction resolvase-like endonuclease